MIYMKYGIKLDGGCLLAPFGDAVHSVLLYMLLLIVYNTLQIDCCLMWMFRSY